MHHAILYISLPSLHPCDVKLRNFYTLALWSRWTQHKSLFPLLNLNTVLSDSTGGNFANNCQIKWNWIRSIKFEAVRIHFLSDVFGLLWSKNFAAMASWRNDFSSLLYVNEIHDVICVNVFFPPTNDIPAQKGLIGPYYTTNGRSLLLIRCALRNLWKNSYKIQTRRQVFSPGNAIQREGGPDECWRR